jgi:ribonucleoside-diphosphate reductase alpha chain
MGPDPDLSDCGKPALQAPLPVTENGRKVLNARYLKKDPSGKTVETPEEMFGRVAQVIAREDAAYEGIHMSGRMEQEFYESMTRLEFLPNSPTLMNAGRELGQLSACFVLPVEDSLESIFETVKNTALIHKSGGGTGFCFSRIRPRGTGVRSTQGVSSGPLSFIRVFDAATDAVKQGGVRRGANMAVLRIDHPDILEFVEAKSCSNELKNFNLSVAVDEPFLKALREGTEYSLVNPLTHEPAGFLDARKVFSVICESAWRCGDPGLIFLDRINRDNPTPCLGSFETTNPCGEQPLLPYESCNLGSINLAKMVCWENRRYAVDYRRMETTVRMAVRFLDDVIDANRYPLPQIEKITSGNRKIGLGVMGWADMLIKLGIPYDSEPAVALAENIMGFIRKMGREVSCELACRRGPYPNFNQSVEAKKRQPLLQRNATITTIAPTGTISIIANCSSGIEPLYALSYVRRHVLEENDLPEIHPSLLEDLSRHGLHHPEILDALRNTGSMAGIRKIPERLRRIYRTALEIAPEWHVRMQAAFQKHCDNGVSKTVNLSFEATPEDVASVYRLAGELGCKGITVYRDRCRDNQVLNIGCVACA